MTPLPRATWEERLDKIAVRAARVDSPFRVTAIYAFGSYARGALASNDLDLIVEAEVVDQDRYKSDVLPTQRRGPTLHGDVRRRVVGHGHPVDLLVYNPGGADAHAGWDPVLVWSPDAPDWKANVAKIKMDSSAGRFARDHVIEIKRSSDNLAEMEMAMIPIREGRIAVRRIPINPDAPPPLPMWCRPGCTPQPATNAMRDVGKKAREAWPFALYWLEAAAAQEGLFSTGSWQSEYGSRGLHLLTRTKSSHVLLGRPSVLKALALLWNDRVQHVALLPHLNRRKVNELVVLTPTPTWLSSRRAQHAEVERWRAVAFP